MRLTKNSSITVKFQIIEERQMPQYLARDSAAMFIVLGYVGLIL
uniref:Uncharacterized protein n=1 Tax=Arundo donax TaxID=35708 RepID=A0A0A9FQI5_ARUDO